MSELAGNVWDDVPELPWGPSGGHQVRNDEYDSGKLAAIVDGDHRFFRIGDAVEPGGPE